jgi:hypothetical protein
MTWPRDASSRGLLPEFTIDAVVPVTRAHGAAFLPG